MQRKLATLLRSRQFFWVVMGFFIFEALWFVFSVVYPMAFDEDFHFGLIKLYSHYWFPFLGSQPAGADQFGAVARDPSFLYQYLLSFPYRLITLFTNNETIQVIILRLVNVALFTAGLFAYVRVMRRAGASAGLINVALAIFILIPIVPQLAAHINYDNLLFLLLPLFCLGCFTVLDGFRARRIEAAPLLFIIGISLLMCLIKYAALPFVAAAVCFLLVALHLGFRRHYRELWPAVRRGFAGVPRRLLFGSLAVMAVGVILFAQRYGVNMARYGTPVPACDKVLTVQQCSHYSPWSRDHGYEQGRPSDFAPDVSEFVTEWFHGMWHRLFFAVSGPTTYYNNYVELPVPSKTAIVLAIAGGGLLIIWLPRVFRRNRYLAFLMAITVGYIVVLMLDEFEGYNRTGVIVAINGRYLVPILLFLAIALGRAFSLTLRRVPQAKTWLAVLAIALFLHGGGIFTFILRSDDSWYWPNGAVTHANSAARKVLAPITIEGRKH